METKPSLLRSMAFRFLTVRRQDHLSGLWFCLDITALLLSIYPIILFVVDCLVRCLIAQGDKCHYITDVIIARNHMMNDTAMGWHR